jgi:hypothetical protein
MKFNSYPKRRDSVSRDDKSRTKAIISSLAAAAIEEVLKAPQAVKEALIYMAHVKFFQLVMAE